MRKFYALGAAFLFFLLMLTEVSWGQLLQQNFTSSTTLSTYINATTPNNGQFTQITSTTGSSVSATGNRLNFTRSSGGSSNFVRSVGFSPSPQAIMIKFDVQVSGNSAASASQGVLYIGTTTGTSGFANDNTAPSNANHHSRFGIGWTTTDGQWNVRRLTGTAASGNNYTGVQTVLWVVNNSGNELSYRGPDGTQQTIGNDKNDLWVGNTLEFDEIDAQTASITAIDKLKFISSGQNGTISIDNILIDPIPSTPTANAPTINATSFNANWATVTGVTGYRLDVATDNGFNNFVTGFNNLYVNSQASTTKEITGASANTQYFYRVRAAAQYDLGEFASGNSSTQSFFTLANVPSAPTLSNATTNSIDLVINENGNPASTEFAIQEAGGDFVQADGSLAATAVWNTKSGWGTKTITGLPANTSYTFKVKARNGANTETAYGATANATTLVGSTPSASITGPVTEQQLHGYALVFTLSNETFNTNTPSATDFTLVNAPANLSIGSVTYTNNTSVTLNLNYTGDFDANITNFNVSVSKDILTSGNGGTNLSSNNITLTALAESLSVGTITAFADQAVNTVSSEKTFTVSGTVRGNVTLVPPAGFEISTQTGVSFAATNPITLSPTGTSLASTAIYVRFKPTAVTSYSGNITAASAGVYDATVAVSGTGIAPANPAFTATAVSASAIQFTASANSNSNNIVVVFNTSGSFTTPTNGVAAGSVGNSFASGEILYKGSAAGFTGTSHTGLTQATTYYYKAFSVDASNFYSVGLEASATTAKPQPGSQPTDIVFSSVSSNSFNVAFTAASGTPDGYLVIRSTGSTLSATPVDGTTYTAGASLGGGTVVSVGSTITGIANTSLSAFTTYYIFVFAYNNSGAITDYLTTLPLNSSVVTKVVAPSPSASNATAVSFDLSWTAVTGADSYKLDVSTVNTFASFVTGYADLTVNGSPVTVTGLSANTQYFFRMRAVNASGASDNSATGNITTVGLSIPTVSAADQITHNSFRANWGSVTGAESYRLDVSTNRSFTISQNFLVENFENSRPGFPTVIGTGSYYSGTTTSSDAPSSANYFASGSSSIGRAGGNFILISDNIDLSSAINPQLTFKLASFSINSTGNGADGGDSVTVAISPDGGVTWYQTLKIVGNLNARWAFDATGEATTSYDGNTSPVATTASSGTSTSGPSNITITNLPSNANVRVSISMKNNDVSELWLIDDFKVSGTVPSFVSGYNNLTVPGAEQPVTGLLSNTKYYYRVRAYSANSTSANSATDSVTTYRDIATADFRTKASGNFSSTGTWEYNHTGSNYQDATQVPGTGNNITVQNGHTLTIDNNFTVGTGKTLTMNATSNMVINHDARLSFTGNGSLNGQSVLLKSSANGTASIGQITGTLTGATNVTVERFIGIPTAKRAWRMLTVPLRSTTSDVSIFNSWQEGGANVANYGMLITGANANAATNGLDVTSGGSMRYFDTTNTTGAWVDVTNTRTTPLFTNAANGANRAFTAFVRGDRSDNVLSRTSTTTLRATGALQTGDQTFPVNATVNGFTMIGNPYASPIDFEQFITDNNVVNSDKVNSTFYVWDPRLGGTSGTGTYVTISREPGGTYSITPSLSEATRHIPSGMAFFVQTKTGAATPLTVTFKESHKSSTTVNNVFRSGVQLEKLNTNIYLLNTTNNTWEGVDGLVARYNNTYSTSVIASEDVTKLLNPTENFSIKRNGSLLSIESRPLIDGDDTLFVSMSNIKQNRSYKFAFDPQNFDAPGLTAYLEDAFVNNETPVSLSAPTEVVFSTTTAAGSFAADRFRIVFKQSSTLSSGGLTVKASLTEKQVRIDWSMVNENNVKGYTVERSADGKTFTALTAVNAKANDNSTVSYDATDANPLSGMNYYRIKATDVNGKITYSAIVRIKTNDTKATVTVYPNPVKGEQLNIQLNGLSKGTYSVRLYNNLGQEVYGGNLQVTQTAMSQTLNIAALKVTGVYTLRITNGEETIEQTIVAQ